MALEIEVFVPQPKPEVRFYGAAARARGRGLANILEFIASEHYYLVVIELPQVQFYDGESGEIDWTVNDRGEVKIEGQINPAAIFANAPIGHKTKRIALCPSEPWGMSFNFPGPVDYWTSMVLFTSETVMELTVSKRSPVGVAGIGPGVAAPASTVSPTLSEIDAMLAAWLA